MALGCLATGAVHPQPPSNGARPAQLLAHCSFTAPQVFSSLPTAMCGISIPVKGECRACRRPRQSRASQSDIPFRYLRACARSWCKGLRSEANAGRTCAGDLYSVLCLCWDDRMLQNLSSPFASFP